MRDSNPLDLNNLPDDYGKQHLIHEDSSSSAAAAVGGGGGYRKKKSGGKDGKDDGKVYECRFCSLKFCKSQALGGHMNRHRQERETETLNRARQLVFNNDNLASQGTPHLSCQPITAGGGCYHPAGDPMMSFRQLYSPRVFPPAGTAAPPPPPQPYPYPSPSRLVTYPPQAQAQQPPVNDYYVGHVLGSTNHYAGDYTYIGAPVGMGSGRDGEEGLSWGRAQPSVINRFQDGF